MDFNPDEALLCQMVKAISRIDFTFKDKAYNCCQ